MKKIDQIIERKSLYRVHGGGVGSWLTGTCDNMFKRLGEPDEHSLSAVRLNQLLVPAA